MIVPRFVVELSSKVQILTSNYTQQDLVVSINVYIKIKELNFRLKKMFNNCASTLTFFLTKF